MNPYYAVYIYKCNKKNSIMYVHLYYKLDDLMLFQK